MKFGKFEINESILCGLLFVLLIVAVLHYTIEEEKIKEQTKQLELQKEIMQIENNIER